MLSPDGTAWPLSGARRAAPEVYVMPAEGGSAQRLTYFNSNCRVVGWSPDGKSILFTSNYQPGRGGDGAVRDRGRRRQRRGRPNCPIGPARAIAFGPDGAVVIGRNIGDPARWKRYRGGTAGPAVDRPPGRRRVCALLAGLAGQYRRADVADRCIRGLGRVFFVSDHEGIGNLYSCRPDGTDLRRHTDHEDYYARNPSSDGRRIVYHAGADLFVFDPRDGRRQRASRLPIAARACSAIAVCRRRALYGRLRAAPVRPGRWL